MRSMRRVTWRCSTRTRPNPYPDWGKVGIRCAAYPITLCIPLLARVVHAPSEPYPLATAICPQDGLLLKMLLVRLTNLFNLHAAVASGLDGVE